MVEGLSLVDIKLKEPDSKVLLNEIAERKFGPNYQQMIEKLSAGFAMLRQEKLVNESPVKISEDFDFLTDMGLTVVSRVLQDDSYYGEALKIRKTDSSVMDHYVLIYKNPNKDDNKAVDIIAFDISKKISNEVRDSYKCSKNIRKIRTTFMSNLSIGVTCDSEIEARCNNEPTFRVSSFSKNDIEKLNNTNGRTSYPGEILEISCFNRKLYPEYQEMKERLIQKHNLKLLENPSSYFNIV